MIELHTVRLWESNSTRLTPPSFGNSGGGGSGRGGGGSGRGGGGREVVNAELKFLWKFKRKNLGWGGVRGSGQVRGGRVDVNEELKFLWKFKKKNRGGGLGVGSGRGVGLGGGGGQGGCERRIEVFVIIQKKLGGGSGWMWTKKKSGGGGRGWVRVQVGEGGWVGGQDGYERRIEVNVKTAKKIGGGGSGPAGDRGLEVGVGRGGGGWLVAILGVGGDVGYGGCEPRIEGIVQCTNRCCTILRK